MKIRNALLVLAAAATLACEDHRFEMDHCRDMCAPRLVKSFMSAPSSAVGASIVGCVCEESPCPAK